MKEQTLLTIFAKKDTDGNIVSMSYMPRQRIVSAMDTDGKTKFSTSYVKLGKVRYNWTENGKNRKKTVQKYVNVPFEVANGRNMTELATAVMEHYASQFVYTALRTTYAHSPNKKIRQLMRECVLISRTSAENAELFAQTFSHDCTIAESDEKTSGYSGNSAEICTYSPELVARMTKNASSHDKIVQSNNAYHGIMMYKVVHHYRMEKCGTRKNGTAILRKMQLSEPKTELKLTKYGSISTNECAIPDTLDVDDLIQTAKLAFIELFNAGLLENVHDLWNYSNYIYKCINHVIMSERRNEHMKEQNPEQNVWCNPDESEKAHTLENILIAKDSNRMSELLDYVRDAIERYADKRVNKKLVISAVTAEIKYNLSNSDVAKILHVDEKVIRRACITASNCITLAITAEREKNA